jgi:hypothetical protein
MTRPPEFDDLVDAGLAPAERQRLRRVHDLLVQAGPPPEPRLGPPVPAARRPRRGALLAIAAALAVALLAFGVAIGNRTEPRNVDFTVAMAGTHAAADAHATLTVFAVDAAGNWPMELDVQGLPPTASGHPYELWLTDEGKLSVLCGSFLTNDDGSAVVPMNAPYRFDHFDGWVVVADGSPAPLLTT